ncbi:MAG: hypothetical protein V3T86_12680 [Planctomycetota bacterium]
MAGALVEVEPQGIGDPRTIRNLPDLYNKIWAGGTTDGKGGYRIDSVRSGKLKLLCTKGTQLLVRRLALHDGEEARVDFRFSDDALRTLTVRCVDAAGDRIDSRFVLLGANGGFAEWSALGGDDEEQPRPRREHVYRVSPGRYRIALSADGYAPIRAMAIELRQDREVVVKLVPGVNLTLTAPDAPGQAVEVRDAEGFRVGIGVTPLEVLFGHGKLRTDAAGAITIPRVAPGTYSVRVGGRDFGTVVVANVSLSRTLRK